MINKASHRIFLVPGLALLFAAVASPAGFADEQSHAADAQSPAQQATPDGKESLDVDTPVGVQHAGRSTQDDGHREQKSLRIAPAEHPLVRTPAPSAGSNVVGRNAIGQPIMQRGPAQPANGRPFGHLQTQPGVPAVRIGGPPNKTLVTTQVAAPNVSPSLAISTRGRIVGSSLTRPRTTRSVLGGPSMPSGAINGTTFPPRR